MTKIIPLNPPFPRQLEFLLQPLQSLLLLLLLLPLLKLLILLFLVLENFSKILTWRSRVFDDGKTLRHNANFLGVISNNRGNHRQIDIPVILHFLYFQPYDAMKLFLACMREDENGDPKIKLLFENCLQRKKYFRLYSSSVRLSYALITVSVMMVFNQAFLN